MGFSRKAALFAVFAGVLAISAAAVAAPVGVYRNSMSTESARGEFRKLSGDVCVRGGSEDALRVRIGKRTRECALRTPVIGRDLEISASARLLSGTPKAARNKAYLALNLRAGEQGAHYQLAIYPLQRKAQLRKVRADGRIEYLEIAKSLRAVKGVNQENELRLRAFNVTSGPDKGSCRILAFVRKQLVADVTDFAAGDLQGRSAAVAVGAAKGAKGIVSSFDDVIVRVPNPFE
jgi:hypothetical protein